MDHITIKICGIKTLEDALAAVEAGADFLGFNFYPRSPRYISPQKCAEVTAGLQQHEVQVSNVGVFVNEPVENILFILDECGLDLAQLSGDESLEDIAALNGRGFKALRLENIDTAFQQAGAYARLGSPPVLLVDSYHPGIYGGTGEMGDWGLASQLAAHYPLLLAGGLHPGNVAQAIHTVHPWGVDVASGVESAPGQKDFQKMLAFIRSAQNCLQEVM